MADGLDTILDRKLKEIEEDELAVKEKEEERARLSKHIGTWSERVKTAREADEMYHKRWAEDRKIARGDVGDYEVNVNLIAAVTEVIAAYLYARDPEQNTRPSASVGRARLADYRMFAKTLEIVVSRLLKNANLKRKAKRWIRGTMTTGPGWLKAAMQTRIAKDPVMEAQINDLKQQMDNIAVKRRQIDENDDCADLDVLEEEIKSNMIAAEAQLELVIAEGLVLDIMKPEDVTVAREAGEIENYLDAPWICFDAYKTKDEVLAITQWETKEDLDMLKGATRYMERPRKGEPNEQGMGFVPMSQEILNKDSDGTKGFYLVREAWSKTDGVVYTWIDGLKDKWAREPYAPITGRRFYPGFLLGFHYMDGERYPQSDVHQLKGLQDEYLETRSDLRKHRRRAVPGIIFDKAAIDEASISALVESTTQEYVGIELITTTPDIRSVLFPKLYNQVDPGLYDTTVINREFEKLSGAQEALQQSIAVEKTATEAKIQQEGFGARTGSRRDELEDVLTDLSEYTAQLALQLFDQADAELYAGPNAVWIPLTSEQVMYMFDFEIKAGSTGKPQALGDRESWATLLPLIEGVIQKIGAARLAGQEWAAKPWIALLSETMDRLDDHADIEQFLPVPPEQVPAEDDGEAEKTASEIKLNEAKTVETLADAISKEPNVARLPIVQQLFGMGAPAPGQPPPQREPATETVASINS